MPAALPYLLVSMWRRRHGWTCSHHGSLPEWMLCATQPELLSWVWSLLHDRACHTISSLKQLLPHPAAEAGCARDAPQPDGPHDGRVEGEQLLLGEWLRAAQPLALFGHSHIARYWLVIGA